jgi:hypothetical protein
MKVANFKHYLTSTEDKFAGHFQDSGNVSGNINVTEGYAK